jgi:hypothetical protein
MSWANASRLRPRPIARASKTESAESGQRKKPSAGLRFEARGPLIPGDSGIKPKTAKRPKKNEIQCWPAFSAISLARVESVIPGLIPPF